LLVDELQHITGFGNVREIDLGLDALFATRRTHAPGTALRFRGGGLEMGPHLLCFMVFERAGVSLFLGDAYRRQHVQDGFAFNFQFPCQIVDSNLTHPPFLGPATAP